MTRRRHFAKLWSLNDIDSIPDGGKICRPINKRLSEGMLLRRLLTSEPPTSEQERPKPPPRNHSPKGASLGSNRRCRWSGLRAGNITTR
jgi:hypothetical protein